MRHTNITVHMAFDKLLVKDNIISNKTDTRKLHERMDRGVRDHGGSHQILDRDHRPETMREIISKGRCLANGEDFKGKIREFIKAKTRTQREKTDLIRAAYGHEVVDEKWIEHKNQYKRNPVDRKKFLENCLKEFKSKNYNLKRHY